MSRQYDYVVEISLPDDAAKLPCKCGSCGWRGMASDVLEIEECNLTPGDPSPVGRCPSAEECGSLVYLDREQDRARDTAPELLDALKRVLELSPVCQSRCGHCRICEGHATIDKARGVA